MIKKICMLATVAVLSFGVAACDETTETQVTETAVVDGTEIETTTTREVTRDGNGDVDTTIEQERTVDPEGLMNQETTTRELEIETETDR